MKTLLLIEKALGWILIAVVGVKIIATTYLGYHAGLPLGEAALETLKNLLDFNERSNTVYFLLFVVGVGLLAKSRLFSRFLLSAGEKQ